MEQIKRLCRQSLDELQTLLKTPLFLTGGLVRNQLLGLEANDVDLCAALPPDRLLSRLEGQERFVALRSFPRMGTVVLYDREARQSFEYTAFRREVYPPGGGHTPTEVSFGDSLEEDAFRRDFTVNALYFEVGSRTLCDPTGGLPDLRNRTLRTVRSPQEVFSHDGLRLFRLCRFAAQLGFEIQPETRQTAFELRELAKDISSDRIAVEFLKTLYADTAYPALTGETFPHYRGLKLWHAQGLLACFLPELTAGDGMVQRGDFHRWDVLEHILQTVRFSHPSVREAALLHDVAKPFQMLTTGRYRGHDEVGAPMAERICRDRLKLGKKKSAEVAELVRLHMVDLDGKTSPKKMRWFVASHFQILDKLMLLKQADFLGCGLLTGECPGNGRLKRIREELLASGAPLSLRELALNGKDLAEAFPDLPPSALSPLLNKLWKMCVNNPALNRPDRLLSAAKGILPSPRQTPVHSDKTPS